MSGSFYSVFKLTSGGHNDNRVKAVNLIQGVGYGIKGLVFELYDGTIGIIMEPYNGSKE